jgi:DNA-binding CsgD family transcriptional regulator/tetratricopeptide (TPR) repeat protein
VLDLAPRAGAEAARLGAHQAALAYFQSALRFSARMPEPDRAALFTAYAHECFLTDKVHEAVTAQETALGLRRGEAVDARVEGLTLADLAEYLWWDGQAEQAFRFATEAVELLESSPADPNLARAYAGLAGMLMRSGRHTIACQWAEKAVELSERSGDEATLVHALNTLGSSETSLRIEAGWGKLEESLARARAANLEEDVSRALNNLIASSREQRCYERLDRYSEEAAAFFDDHDLDASERCLIGDIVEGLFERGRWAEATSRALPVVVRPSIHGRVQCVAVLGRVTARRGEPDAFAFFDEALTLQESFGGERMYPLRAARAEAALLAGDARRAAREIEAAVNEFDEHSNPWHIGEFAFWARQSGVDWHPPIRPAEPYALYLDGHPDKAAAAWAGLGCSYEEALCLAGCDEVIELQQALGIFQSLGGAPAARMVTERLRTMGVQRLARGPRRNTRSNLAGLSDRELQVLTLLAGGKRNAEIAGELVVSTRTVDHHVSAILTKLGVRSRYEAGRKAVELGIGPQ